MAKLVCNFISYALKRTVDITVVLPSVTIPEAMQLPMPGKENPVPPTHEVKEKYPVLYLLHGMGNNHAQWTGYTNVELFAEERNMAVVMISGENKFYHDSLDGEPFFDFGAQLYRRIIDGWLRRTAARPFQSGTVCSDWFLLRRSHAGGRSGKSGRSD